MEKKEIIKSLAARGDGEIYLGVVGAVRTGKSTFIKRLIENMVVPHITDSFDKVKCLDEIPQTAEGKQIMTTEPKFVPSNGASINIDGMVANIKLVDCVGFVIPSASGYEDESGNPRMVKTPWFTESIPFIEAAEIGTEKVIKDHATIGIVVTTDGSFGELKRDDYLEAEEKVITELLEIGKPFIIIVNTNNVDKSGSIVANELRSVYDVPVLPINVEEMKEEEIVGILKEALYEYSVDSIAINIPDWVDVLPNTHYLKVYYLEKIRNSVASVKKVRDIEKILEHFSDSEYIKKAYISKLNSDDGSVEITLESTEELYNTVLNEFMGNTTNNKAGMLKIFANYSAMASETETIKSALKTAKSGGYGIVYPNLRDMRLETPEIIKQGNRYGVKLKAVASSIHMMKVDVESVFEPIIGSELQSKELINHLMKDFESNPDHIWKSEIFGRSLDEIVKEGINAKLSIMPENTRYKLAQTVTKIVNKGSSNLIAFVL